MNGLMESCEFLEEKYLQKDKRIYFWLAFLVEYSWIGRCAMKIKNWDNVVVQVIDPSFESKELIDFLTSGCLATNHRMNKMVKENTSDKERSTYKALQHNSYQGKSYTNIEEIRSELGRILRKLGIKKRIFIYEVDIEDSTFGAFAFKNFNTIAIVRGHKVKIETLVHEVTHLITNNYNHDKRFVKDYSSMINRYRGKRHYKKLKYGIKMFLH